MTSSMSTFPQFHLALTGLANHPSIGVVPLGLESDGSFRFGPLDAAMPRIAPMLNVDRSRDSGADPEIERLFKASRDNDLFEKLAVLRSIFDNRMNLMMPVEYVQAAGLDRMVEQVAGTLRPEREEGGVFDIEGAAREEGPFPDSQFNPSLEFSRLTVGDVAGRLSTIAFLEGGGYCHADLAEALLTRGQALAREVSELVLNDRPDDEAAGDPTEIMFAAGVLYANMKARWALSMAEQAFSAAAVEFLQFPIPDNISAAMLYELKADLRDRREGGGKKSNPIRSMAAGQWLASLVFNRDSESWNIRVFRGLANAWLAGRRDLYSELAHVPVKRAIEETDPLTQAGFLIRSVWGFSDHLRVAGVEDPGISFWTMALGRLGAVSMRLEEAGDAEVLEIVEPLVDAALRFISVRPDRG